MSRSARTLGALLRAGEPGALESVRSALEAESGRVEHAARRLGVSPGTLHRWLGEIPGLGGVVRWGRGGPGPR